MSVTIVPFTSTAGNFTVAHGVPGGPAFLPTIQMFSLGIVSFQSPTSYDATNLYLTGSDDGLTGADLGKHKNSWLQIGTADLF